MGMFDPKKRKVITAVIAVILVLAMEATDNTGRYCHLATSVRRMRKKMRNGAIFAGKEPVSYTHLKSSK